MIETPCALMLDPLTWDHGWSYEVEENRLAAQGVELLVPADVDEQLRLVSRADVIVSSGIARIDSARLATFERCIGIVCYSAGLDAVDLAAANTKGIPVSGVHANTAEVADHAMALMLAAHRLIVPMAALAARGEWDLRTTPEIWKIPRLSDQVLGIVGAGRVGRQVGVRARGFGMRTIATYHHEPEVADTDLPHRPLAELMATADIIVVCAALTPESRHLIDERALAAVKPNALLVNVGRGGLIDESALEAALDERRLRGVALDVRDSEPPPAKDWATGRPNVLQTPHMGGASSGALRDLPELAADTILAMLSAAGRLPPVPPQQSAPRPRNSQITGGTS